MKILFVLVFWGLCLAEGFILSNNQKACTDPENFQSFLCQMIPAGCLSPVCVIDEYEESLWFKSRCHMLVFNIRCRTKFRPANEEWCISELRPSENPGFCPIPSLSRQ